MTQKTYKEDAEKESKNDQKQLVLVLTAHYSDVIIRDVMRLALPTIPPMTRSPFSNLVPDYVVLSGEINEKGTGGFLCTGFWNNHWDYDQVLSSCIC